MPLFEDRSAAFIVRVWCETGGGMADAVRAWRGSIEHVATGERTFFTELDAVIAFMRPHLVRLGIEEPTRFWEHVDDLAGPLAQPGPQPGPVLPLLPASTGGRKPPRHGR